MGPSPAEPTEVLLVFGSLMLLAFVLAIGFWMAEWWKSHPGAIATCARTLRIKFTTLVKRATGQDSENHRNTNSQLGESRLNLPG